MKTLHYSIIGGAGISVFFLFYFLFPVMTIDLWCQIKESNNSTLGRSIATNSPTWTMFDYNVFLLNGGQLEQSVGKCTIYH